MGLGASLADLLPPRTINEILEKSECEHRLQVEKSLEDYHRKIMHHATVLMKGLICNDSVVVSKGTAAKNEYLEEA